MKRVRKNVFTYENSFTEDDLFKIMEEALISQKPHRLRLMLYSCEESSEVVGQERRTGDDGLSCTLSTAKNLPNIKCEACKMGGRDEDGREYCLRSLMLKKNILRLLLKRRPSLIHFADIVYW